jgi:serine/threonine-protein kinase RsbW
MILMSKNKKYSNSICTVCDLEELSRIRSFIMGKAASSGFSDDDSQKIALAVDEACSNLIQHAYHFNLSKIICVNVETSGNKFIINILDDGKPFNPLDVNSPDMKEYFANFKRGGLGIHLMRSIMDRVEYSPSSQKSKNNTLRLIKNFS